MVSEKSFAKSVGAVSFGTMPERGASTLFDV